MFKIYFYSDPVFLYIDSDTILDLNLRVVDGKKIFEMEYKDDFFTQNLKRSKSKNWMVFIQSYGDDNTFQLQSNLNGDKLKHRKIKNGYYIRLEYDQITNNKIWASLPPSFDYGEIEYKNSKLAYIRNLKLGNLLNQK